MSTKNDVRNSESILIVELIDYGYCILRELRKTFCDKAGCISDFFTEWENNSISVK